MDSSTTQAADSFTDNLPPQPSPFFRLPRELRDWVYAYVFTDKAGLRYEYGTARLLGSSPHFWALRSTCRQARQETVDFAFRHNDIVFDNLGGRRIARPNYRKYFNRWDTEYSEEDPSDPARDAIAKPVVDRVQSFLSRVPSAPQRALLRGFTVVELRPLEHISALLDAFDAHALPDVTLTVTLVPSVLGTYQFDDKFPRALERLFVKRWFRASRHTVRVRLDPGFDGLEDWIRTEFPTASNAPVQLALLRQLRDLQRLTAALNALKKVDGDGDDLTLEYLPTSFLLLS
ncbi:uncharacterized protein BKCO1_200093 [Diplodia corticola]|uniref:Uncharacterized protein n=1 Tax=Diplodia corticola TaxID=236234 RepID=A0A1J9SK42_9PEZI|nr:uncharacterized protein BKCO1_200093 [Diplodia corticola]OJD39973.1 hypothetical protein BKCO1_200093 [Diplodia corticola]